MAVLTPELVDYKESICHLAHKEGLDFYETIFELVDLKTMQNLAAYGGFPVRYPHWRFGMEYDRLLKTHRYGFEKIYELVINNDPCYAYLMEGNKTVDQKLVMAHVYGHSDFFKNNEWFKHTSKNMMNKMANHSSLIRSYEDRYGAEVVENLIDKCLSFENLIDRYRPYREFSESKSSLEKTSPEKPFRDLFWVFIHFAPLEDWQKNILEMIREESYYFAPQMMTKIMNEGWASFWHSKLLTESVLENKEIVEFAQRHSGSMVMSEKQINPYKLGIELFRYIKWRWDWGQFGKDWEGCRDFKEKESLKRKTDKGMEKIFEVRKTHNDVTFIDEFFTEDFCMRHKLFSYNKESNKDSEEFKKFKKKLLFQLTNSGQPVVHVLDLNFEGKGYLLLEHVFELEELHKASMQATLENIEALWGKPVWLKTVSEGVDKLFYYTGQEHGNRNISCLKS